MPFPASPDVGDQHTDDGATYTWTGHMWRPNDYSQIWAKTDNGLGGGDDEAYGATWNGATEAPSKNAVYDQIESLVVSGGGVSPVNSPLATEFARFVSPTSIEGRTASETRSDLGLVIGTNVQAFDADLSTIAAANNGAVLAATTASFTTADETKLDGIAAGATVYTDEMARDALGAALVAGANVTITPNDAGNTITIEATGGGGGVTLEQVQDDLGNTSLVAGTGLTKTYDDVANTITVAAPGLGQGRTGTVYLDDFAGANDDAKFTAALTYAAAQSRIPWIEFPARSVTLTTGGRTPFTGMKLCGPGGRSGMQNYQIASGATTICDINLTGSVGVGTSALFHGTGTYYDINVQGLTFRSNNTAGFWHQPTGTLYACTFRDLMFYGMVNVFGTTATPCLVTFCHFEGDWTVAAGSSGDTVFHFGGSDSTFWKKGCCNLQNGNNPTIKDNYQIIFTNMSKSAVGHLFVTSSGGWRGMLVTGTVGESLVFEGSIFEGYSGNTVPGHACMVRITNGHVQMNNVYVSHAMAAPTFYGGTSDGVIEITGGEVAINGGFYVRGEATASYGGVGAVPETVPWVHMSGGTVAIRDVMGAKTWSGVPRVHVAGGTLRDWDSSIVDQTGAPFRKPGWGMVNHGATAGTARPTEFQNYIWYGSVQPSNMTGQDIVIRTDEAV